MPTWYSVGTENQAITASFWKAWGSTAWATNSQVISYHYMTQNKDQDKRGAPEHHRSNYNNMELTFVDS